MQVSETYSQEEGEKTLSLITGVITEPAHKSDTDALIPLIEATQKRGLGPEQALVDALYGSDENCEKAKVLGVEVVSPVMGKSQGDRFTLAEFTLNEESTVTACPQGHAPIKVKHKKGNYTAVFGTQTCQGCLHLKDCPVKCRRKGYYLHYNDKALRLAKRRAYEKTPAFRELYRFRAGIEGTMSQLDRKTGLKQLRVRGLAAVSFCATLKAAGINLFRAVTFRNSEIPRNPAPKQGDLGLFDLIYVFKERLAGTMSTFIDQLNYSFGIDSQIVRKFAF